MDEDSSWAMGHWNKATERTQDRLEVRQDVQGLYPGLEACEPSRFRQYKGAGELPRVKNGLGIAIVPPKGVMSDKRPARRM